ncbi:MAG: transporter permease [Enterovirga sp.]|jgi:NitT/TauT family transport system permease protein|nr:transporter permease [Enterovirga sp.]
MTIRADGSRPASVVEAVALPVLTGLAVFALWQFGTSSFGVSEVLLPPPTAIAARFRDLLPTLLVHTGATAGEIALASGVALGGGAILAGLLTLSPGLYGALMPTIVLFQIIPKIALAPLFVFWLGIGSPSRLVFAIFLSFFPVLVSTAAGLQLAGSEAVRLCRSLGATRWQILRDVRIPSAAEHFFSGAKVTVTLAVIGVIASEFISAKQGLGYFILLASSRADTSAVFAALTMLCIIGLGFYLCVLAAERAVLRALYG